MCKTTCDLCYIWFFSETLPSTYDILCPALKRHIKIIIVGVIVVFIVVVAAAVTIIFKTTGMEIELWVYHKSIVRSSTFNEQGSRFRVTGGRACVSTISYISNIYIYIYIYKSYIVFDRRITIAYFIWWVNGVNIVYRVMFQVRNFIISF